MSCFVPHQANGVLLAELAERCGLGSAHTHLTLSRYGNVGSASVPVALDDADEQGLPADGDLVLLAVSAAVCRSAPASSAGVRPALTPRCASPR
ncbi:3-oxoacyl-[acyl-carrier-protein] synthase III C-terminal domain-containing protein [Streptomyces monashensis]|uniref:3-oxoacyl-[acyl-carrier-protein] synthase III C-terminal domain-containing protein n=1 Tax=Streptomyces monashensis TaxID=1678012 RepID=UPI001FE28183|nr:3-oxoacyl-[acyl-carrier-protein] synthase III C-terminal domain-containing protein [Streptomyces monashensis]